MKRSWTMAIWKRIASGLLAFGLIACAHQDPAELQTQVDVYGLTESPTPTAESITDSRPVHAVPALPQAGHATEPASAGHAQAPAPEKGPESVDHETALSKTLEAIRTLKTGNARFAGVQYYAPRRVELTAGQHPVAAVLCCSDSRVPPELIFQQGLGDIFVIRVAGNVVTPEVLGSIEYAVEHLHVPLVVVLGHEGCGAVKAAVEGGEAPGSIGSLVERIAPSVKQARKSGATDKTLVETTVDLNIDAMTQGVMASPVIAEAIAHHQTQVFGAKYHLSTGEVTWR